MIKIDRIIRRRTSEAVAMVKLLAQEEGLLVGVSAGANVVASLKIAEILGP
jgi:cysteine synthase A